MNKEAYLQGYLFKAAANPMMQGTNRRSDDLLAKLRGKYKPYPGPVASEKSNKINPFKSMLQTGVSPFDPKNIMLESGRAIPRAESAVGDQSSGAAQEALSKLKYPGSVRPPLKPKAPDIR